MNTKRGELLKVASEMLHTNTLSPYRDDHPKRLSPRKLAKLGEQEANRLRGWAARIAAIARELPE